MKDLCKSYWTVIFLFCHTGNEYLNVLLWFFASFVLIENICTVDYEINPIATDKRTNKDVSDNLVDQRC